MIKHITIPYRNYNEDGLIIDNNLYVVIDGATTLFDEQSNDYSSVASKLVRYMEVELVKQFNLNNNFILSIENVSKSSYEYFNYNTNVPSKLPSAGIAAVIESKDYYDVYLLGDLSVTYSKTNGEVINLLDNSLGILDNEVINLIKLNSKEEVIKKRLIDNRNALGTRYQAFIPSLEPRVKVIHKRLIKSGVKELLIASDGYYSALDTFNIVSSYNELLRSNLNDLVDKIKDVATTDKNLIKYPRLKQIDDISAIKISNKKILV